MGERSQVPGGDGHVTVHRSAPAGSEPPRCLIVHLDPEPAMRLIDAAVEGVAARGELGEAA